MFTNCNHVVTSRGLNNVMRNYVLRHLSTKRKYPLDPEHAKELPISQYIERPHRRNRVYVWGCAKTGALGVQQQKKEENSKRVEFLKSPKRFYFAENYNVTVAACGFGFSLFGVAGTDNEHLVYGTGLNDDSQIGYHEVRHEKPLGVLLQPRPLYLPLSADGSVVGDSVQVLAISAGRAHAAVLTTQGLFTFGNNSYGQCGRRIVEDEKYAGSKYVHHTSDIDGEKIIDVICGQDHSLVLTESGKVYSTGWGADGQTGVGHYNTVATFTQVLGDIAQERIVKLACRSDFVLSLNDKGQVFGWGNTEYSQMPSLDGSQQVCLPRCIEMCANMGKIKDVAAGGSFCMILNEQGDVYVWGFGLLGTGPAVTSATRPVILPATLFGRNAYQPDATVRSIVAGLSHAAAVTASGDLYTWGRNRYSCLGLGTADRDQYFPLKVAIGGTVDVVSCGLDHTIAICKSFVAD